MLVLIKKELSQDTFKFNIEIKRITANHGACKVRDCNRNHNEYNLSDNLISSETPLKMCYESIANSNWIICKELVEWTKLSKEDCNYEYKYDIDSKSENYKHINERVEKTQDPKYIENCKKAKKVAKEKYNGKYYYDYKMPMKFGETK